MYCTCRRSESVVGILFVQIPVDQKSKSTKVVRVCDQCCRRARVLLFFFFPLIALMFRLFVGVWRGRREKPNQNSRSQPKNFDTSLFDSNATRSRVSEKNLAAVAVADKTQTAKG